MSKRYLTNIEIENILDFIVPQRGIPEDSAQAYVEIAKNKLRKQLKLQQVYPQIIPELKQNIEKLYFKSKADAGLSVGIISAQSIGEKQTQQTLNSFHKTGLIEKTVVTGVPRFLELINATKNQKANSCNIYF